MASRSRLRDSHSSSEYLRGFSDRRNLLPLGIGDG
jgi:hypothetical protein